MRSLDQYKDDEQNYYEIIYTMEYGESDRIDVSRIQTGHITEFLRNTSILLDDIKKLQGIYHVNKELKLGGFKPIQNQIGWKNEICQKYGFFRLDLFMLGLLWLEFSGHDISFITEETTLQNIHEQLIKYILDNSQNIIVKKFLDLDQYSDYTVEQTITDFEEQSILEQLAEDDQNRAKQSVYSNFKGSLNDDNSQRFTDQNPFKKNYISNFSRETDNKSSEFNNFKNDYFALDDFTLQEKQSRTSEQRKQNFQSIDKYTKINIQEQNNLKRSQTFSKEEDEDDSQLTNSKVMSFKDIINKKQEDKISPKGQVKVYLNQEIGKNYDTSSKSDMNDEGYVSERFPIQSLKQSPKGSQKQQQVIRDFKKQNSDVQQISENKEEQSNYIQEQNQEQYQINIDNVGWDKIQAYEEQIDNEDEVISNQINKNVQEQKKPMKFVSKDEISSDEEDKQSLQNTQKKQLSQPDKKIKKKEFNNQKKPLKKPQDIPKKSKEQIKQIIKPKKQNIDNEKMRQVYNIKNKKNITPTKLKMTQKSKSPIRQGKSNKNKIVIKRNKSKYLDNTGINIEVKSKPKVNTALHQAIKEQNQDQDKKNKILKQALKRISYNQKDNLFTFTNKMKNKNIPFKSLYKSKQKSKEDLKSQYSEQEKQIQQSDKIIPVKTKKDKFKLFNPKNNFFYKNDLINIDSEILLKFPLEKCDQIFLENIEHSHDYKNVPLDEKLENIQRNSKQNIITMSELQRQLIQNFEEEVIEEDKELKQFYELLANKDIEKAQNQLIKIKEEGQGIYQLEIFKILAYIHIINQNFKKALQYLEKGIQFLEQSDIYDQQPILIEFLLQIAYCHFLNDNFNQSLTCLENQNFKNQKSRTVKYYFLKGDCFSKLNNIQNAQKQYEIIIDYYLLNGFDENQKIFLLQSIERILKLFENTDPYQAIDYYKEIRLKIQKNLNQNTHNMNLTQFQIDLLKYNNGKNNTLQNFLLNDIIDKDPSLNQSQIEDLNSLLIKFSQILWNSKNFSKLSPFFEKYMKKSLELQSLIKNQNNTQKNEILVINYRLGHYYLQKEKFVESQTHFLQCKNIYTEIYKNPGSQYAYILYFISKTMFQLGQYEECSNLLEEIIQNQNESENITIESCKLLVETYYVLGNYKTCSELMENLLIKLQQQNENDLFHFFAIYLVVQNFENNKFDNLLTQFKEKQLIKGNKYKLIYLSFFNNYYVMNNQNFLKKDYDFDRIFQSKFDKRIQKEVFNIYFKEMIYYTLKIKDSFKKPIYYFIKSFDLENSDLSMIMNLMSIIYFLDKNQVNQYDDIQKRSNLLNMMNKISNQEKLNSNLENILNQENNKNFLIQIEKPKNNFLLSTQINDLKKTNDQTYLQYWNLNDRSKCICSQQAGNYEILEIIDEFLKQIKNMLFLDMTQKITEYFKRFEEIIKRKNLKFGKYDYLRRIFQIHLRNNKNSILINQEFTTLLDEIINDQFCIHDYKIVVIYLESFKNIQYMEAFVFFLDKNFPMIAKIILRELFYQNFFIKFDEISEKLLQKIMDSKFYKVDNTPLVCLLGDEILEIDKKFSFHFFQRFRYYFLIDEDYQQIFQKYFAQNELIKFYKEWIIYNLLVNVVRKDEDSLKYIQKFLEELQVVYESDIEIDGNYFMKILAAFYLLKFTNENKENMRMALLDIISHSEKKINDENQGSFALLVSNLSNLFYKNQMRKDSMILKKQSYEIARGLSASQQPKNWDSHFKGKDFDLKTYDLMNSLIEKEDKEIEEKYNSLKQEQAQNKIEKLEKQLVSSVYFQHKNDTENLRQSVLEAQENIKDLKGFEKDLYQAILDSVVEKNDSNSLKQSRQEVFNQLKEND